MLFDSKAKQGLHLRCWQLEAHIIATAQAWLQHFELNELFANLSAEKKRAFIYAFHFLPTTTALEVQTAIQAN